MGRRLLLSAVDRGGVCPLRRLRCLGFTMVELLVVIAVVGVLIGLLLPALGRARGVASEARERASAQQLAVAYTVYADDHGGAVLVGHPTSAEVNGPMWVRDWTGERITGELARRYPWRLAPYLDFNVRGMYQSDRLLSDLRRESPEDFTYYVSLFPSMGLNIEFLGGSDIDGYAFNPQVLSMFGRYYVKRVDEAQRPSGLVSFVSARGSEGSYPVGVSDPWGYFRLRPPSLFGEVWSRGIKPSGETEAGLTGFVDFRWGGRAVAAHLDGHAESLKYEELLDMRRWADRATGEAWVVSAGG